MTYEETLKSVKKGIASGTFEFPVHEDLDYTGVGFGYRLQKSYPKTWTEAIADTKTPKFDELLAGGR